jgi:carbon starvation protein CstA
LFRFINEYSFPILLAVFAVSVAFLLPAKTWQMRMVVMAGVVALVLGGYAFLRPGASTVKSVAEADALIQQIQAAGQPVFIEFFSNT